MEKVKKSGCSTNAGKNPYAKNDFEGTEEIKKAFANRPPVSANTFPLMSDEDLKVFYSVRATLQTQFPDTWERGIKSFMEGWIAGVQERDSSYV